MCGPSSCSCVCGHAPEAVVEDLLVGRVGRGNSSRLAEVAGDLVSIGLGLGSGLGEIGLESGTVFGRG